MEQTTTHASSPQPSDGQPDAHTQKSLHPPATGTASSDPRLIFVSSSPSNTIINPLLAGVIRDAGAEGYFPDWPAAQTDGSNSGVPDTVVDALQRCVCVVVVARAVEPLTAWVCGYATSKGKPIRVIATEADLEEDENPEHARMLLDTLPDEDFIVIPRYDRSTMMGAIGSILRDVTRTDEPSETSQGHQLKW